MKLMITLLLIIAGSAGVLAQTIYGRIIDTERIPVQEAYILHVNSGIHTHSNEIGSFALKDVAVGDTLRITHLGYETQDVIISDLSEKLEIELKEAFFQLSEIVVGQNIKAINLITEIDLQTNPVNTSQEILRKVPGLIIGQHAGGGKAEQIFLRGFDIDHGTDINISVDGLPVNMVSHAHGQGYADLHFLIPETIETIDFGKGPYYADQGNFATAGYVEFNTKDRLRGSSVAMEVGRFNSIRTVGLFDVLSTDNHSAYLATEYLISDGPFEASQNFDRLNLMAKYTANLSGQDRISVLASHFTSQWDASGQIPNRAVESGLISRFGAIDDTEGGTTSRTNLALEYDKNIDNQTYLRNRIYYSLYDFELYSNFTFFLNDPVNGDQIRQREKRSIFGFESTWNHTTYLGNTATLLQAGVGVRFDNSNDNELSRTRNRDSTLEVVQLGNIDESNFFGFVNAEFDFGRLLINPGVRVDYFEFDYIDEVQTIYDPESDSKTMVSPKLNFIYNYSDNVQFFLKSGVGFHSNDTRVILRQEGDEILPAAYGADLGTIWKPSRQLVVDVALWYLFLEQEFVYVGDEGIVEPSGRSERQGVDFGLRYQPLDWLFLDGNINYTYARSIDEPEGLQFIPLAPDLTATGGLSVQTRNFIGGVRFRYVDDRPANEDDSINAEGYFITDLNAIYNWDRVSIGINIENLFDNDWNETQFATESRLALEQAPVEEIHFTPGIPFFIEGRIRYAF